MTVRAAGLADLPRLHALATEFYASSEFLEGFDLARFVSTWAGLLESGNAAVYLLEHNGAIAGTIGGVLYPEIYSGRLVASEFFWFVSPALRGAGLKLYRAFEDWARERGAQSIRMVHLLDSMPGKLERVYQHLGFKPAEIHYTKDLVTKK